MESIKEYKEFIELLEKALSLGLKVNFKKDSKVADIGFSTISRQLHIYAASYQVLDHNGVNSSHALCDVFTRKAADNIKNVIDSNIINLAKGRNTRIEENMNFYEKKHLLKFIEIREKEDSLLLINIIPTINEDADPFNDL